ncbi:MAG: YicC/YloC family endoribonuclease [Candidatus Binatus sp.]|uniref:YicC/YloC family endoribonuclease n=1 Tax=Candidatus Binatus sp. TaxID=2811406 RepID=UPI002727512D|nr:YicC/YloC family endoribonuclease [Candidatus Binatus sp.]MDO8431995.1 YicC/YloC family endoribonuclease [Candidatus Binatus sp.]
MKSMTGFGRASVEHDGTRVIAEVRALNQRFFELKLAVPRGWGEHEAEIRKLVQAVVARGRVEVFIKSVALKPPPVRLEVNDKLATLYINELRRMGKRLHLDGDPALDTILNRPEIFHVVEEEADSASAATLGFKALKGALKELDLERIREGKSLQRDFAARVAHIEAALPKIERLAEQSRAEIMENFQKRIRELLNELPVNEKRLYEEASSASQHGDISEEITRLRTHLDGLKALLKRSGQVGKSIEFLLQEINREVNTMGSKSQNAALSQVTVEVKAEAEKMREQVQNVE